MDVISYVLGLFTDMSWGRYVLATAIGLAPSAFLLAWLGRLPNAFTIMTLGVAAMMVAAFIVVVRRGKATA